MAMQVIDPGTREFGQTSLGSDFRNQKMYQQYVDLYNHFNSIGQPDLADQLTLQMEQQYSVPGGTQPMLDSFENISQGGTGGYDANTLAQLTGNVPLITKQQLQQEQTNNAMVGKSLNQLGDTASTVSNIASDPNKDNVQKGIDSGKAVASGLGALGVGGLAVPVIGAGLGVAGAVYDYNKQVEAEKEMQRQLRNEEARRDIASAKYNRELDNEYARRELGFRGQTQTLPMYQKMMAQAGKGFANQQQANLDLLEKTGQSTKSGMGAQLAGQNFTNLSKNIANATKDSVINQSRAYGGLQGLATSGRPETNQFNYAQSQYDETQGFGEHLRPLTNLVGAYGKKKFRDAGLGYMNEEYNENIGKQGVN